MEYITRLKARQNIVALGLPQIVLDVFDEKPLPYNLDVNFREPYTIFCLRPEEQAPYGEGRITPIWTGGGDYIVVAYHHGPEREGYFRFDIETPDELQPIGLNWQQILLKEFVDLWEQDFLEDDKLREVASWFRFDYIDSLLAELPKADRGTFEKSEKWFETVLQKLGR